jgi:hypothetical protein
MNSMPRTQYQELLILSGIIGICRQDWQKILQLHFSRLIGKEAQCKNWWSIDNAQDNRVGDWLRISRLISIIFWIAKSHSKYNLLHRLLTMGVLVGCNLCSTFRIVSGANSLRSGASNLTNCLTDTGGGHGGPRDTTTESQCNGDQSIQHGPRQFQKTK